MMRTHNEFGFELLSRRVFLLLKTEEQDLLVDPEVVLLARSVGSKPLELALDLALENKKTVPAIERNQSCILTVINQVTNTFHFLRIIHNILMQLLVNKKNCIKTRSNVIFVNIGTIVIKCNSKILYSQSQFHHQHTDNGIQLYMFHEDYMFTLNREQNFLDSALNHLQLR